MNKSLLLSSNICHSELVSDTTHGKILKRVQDDKGRVQDDKWRFLS